MKYAAQVLLLMVVCLSGIGCTGDRVSGGGPLRMADSLEGWGYYLADPDARMEDVWRIEDGVLVCIGRPLGYLYTKAEYADFVLKLQWRWPDGKGPGKAGVLIRTVGEHMIWPKSLEAQLNWPDAGDFWGLAGYELSGPPDRTRSIDHEQFGKLTNVKKTAALEKPPGQWNTYEIIARGDTVTLIINGQEVNRATGCDPDPGRICLTSEGSEIHFKNVVITAADRE